MLEVGTKAPDFTLPDQDGVEHSLSDYRGKKVVLYFYPKDNTAGCTKQACGFAELYPQIQEKGAVEQRLGCLTQALSGEVRASLHAALGSRP